jgi:hypothetical protein
MSTGTQNMKTEPDTLENGENESGSAKHENGTRRASNRRKRVRESKTWKRDLTPSLSPNTSLGAQNMKTGPDALRTVETCPGAKNMKTGPDDLRTAENVFGSAKHENGTRRPLNRRKQVRERKT